MFGLLTKPAEIRRTLPVRGRIDKRDQQSLVRKHLPGANKKIPLTPSE
jgi:hypothetical protein